MKILSIVRPSGATNCYSGGKLVLFEYYNEQVTRAQFAFGLLPGWWRSEFFNRHQCCHSSSTAHVLTGSEESRQRSPLIAPESWHNFLTKSGFSGADLTFSDFEDARNQLGNTMVSTAVASTERTPTVPSMRIIVDRDSELQSEVAQHLTNQLRDMGAIECDIVHVENVHSTHSARTSSVFLPKIERSFLRDIPEQDFAILRSLLTSDQDLIWVNQGGGQPSHQPELNTITGICRTVHSERFASRSVQLALEASSDTSYLGDRIATFIARLFEHSNIQEETEYEERNGMFCISRIVEANYLNEYIYAKNLAKKIRKEAFGLHRRPLLLHMASPGFLDTLQYVPDCTSERLVAEDEVELRVKAVGVNFKDVLIVLGRLPQDEGLGNECAGMVTRAGSRTSFAPGDRVLACASGTYRTNVRSKASLVFKIPPEISFAEAAALPVVYITSYFALYECARLKHGESILIHSGAGGTGQAAIPLARLRKAKIFVTVGSQEKKRLLMRLYDIPADQVLSSRGLSFMKGIKRLTLGKGVDVVLNSLAGESLQGSWDSLAPFGRFVEIGKNDILKGNKLPMSQFNENRTFSAVNQTHLLKERPEVIRQIMDAILALRSHGSICPPMPLHKYSVSGLEEAFRYLQSGQNTGKTILEMNDDDLVPVRKRTNAFTHALLAPCFFTRWRPAFSQNTASAKMDPI